MKTYARNRWFRAFPFSPLSDKARFLFCTVAAISALTRTSVALLRPAHTAKPCPLQSDPCNTFPSAETAATINRHGNTTAHIARPQSTTRERAWAHFTNEMRPCPFHTVPSYSSDGFRKFLNIRLERYICSSSFCCQPQPSPS